MSWADWIGRALCLAVTFGASELRTWAYTPENDIWSVALCQCLSALANTCGLIAASLFVRGKASFDLQRLAYCAIVVNFLGFIAYAAKSSPSVYWANSAITVISYAQLLRILWPGDGRLINLSRRNGFFRAPDIQGASLYMEKKK